MFTSMIFPVFLGIVAALFFLLPAKWHPGVLLFASYIFCGWIDSRALAVLVLVSLCTWMSGMKIENAVRAGEKGKGKAYTGITICFYILILCFYKYSLFFLEDSDFYVRLSEDLLSSLIMPVGLSFYLFQAIGYLADIYQEKSHAEKSFLCLSLYFAFFPKLVSGPVEREQDFLSQIKKLTQVTLKNRGRLSTASTYLLWGYFMKMVVADRLAVTVNRIFYEPASFDSFWLILGAFLYTMQIYCDFAGYSYIAIGCAEIFGIHLTQNFRAPYLAASITDFWRRWHISLSTWLRDYIYISLGGSRKGIARKCVNTMIVFLICGMWHGVGFQFIVWGLLHGIYSVAETWIRRRRLKIPAEQGVTFLAVAFAWIFFRASDFSGALFYVERMFTCGFHLETWRQTIRTLQLSPTEALLAVVGIGVVWAVDLLCDRKQLHLPVLIQKKQNAVRYFVFYLLIVFIFVFGVYGPGYHVEQFIYMKF